MSLRALEAEKKHGAKAFDERPRLGEKLQLVKLKGVSAAEGVGELEAIGACAQTLARDWRLDYILDIGHVVGLFDEVVLALRVQVDAGW